MNRLFSLTLLLGVVALLLTPLPSWSAPDEQVKEALQAVGEFIGDWKGSGGPDKVKLSSKDPIWNEQISWSWKFKGDDAWLTMTVKKGKYFKSADLRYLPAKKLYELTAITADDAKQVFTGKIKNEALVLERKDPESKELQVLTMTNAAEGARFIYRLARKKEGSTILTKDFLVATTREGVSLGAKEKKNECVVSGGLGTMQVSYKGETFYVCCSGCADAFKENPEKYIAEFKAKKKK
jgi:hypothetical protein